MKNKTGTSIYKNGLILIVIIGLAVGMLQLGATQPEKIEVPMAQVMKNSFDITVRSIGVLDAGQAHMVVSTLKGGKGKVIDLVDDGSWVKKGNILVRLDPAPFEEEIESLEGDLKRLMAAVEAKKQLFEWEKNQVTRELGTAEFKVNQAELEFSTFKNGEGPLQLIQYREEMDKIDKDKKKYLRYLNDLKKLSTEGFDHPGEMAKAEQELLLLKEKFNTAQKKVDSYQNHLFPSMLEKLESNIDQAEMELEQTKKGSVHQIAQAKSSLNEVQAAFENHNKRLENARKKLFKTVIQAPSDGIVILYETYRDGQKRKPRVGDTVLQNQPILYLPDISTMIVKTRVREVDLHKVTIGQACDLTMEAYPDKKIKGNIAFIGALAAETSGQVKGAKYFQMTIKLTTTDSDLRPGMTSRVSILADRVENVLILPVHAIFENLDQEFCFLYQNGIYKKIVVETGRENEDFVEIISGIHEGDWVSTVEPAIDKEL